jgi:excinuclease ABC subunit B
MLYERNDIQLKRGKFRVRGDVIEVVPAYLDNEAIRIEFFGDEIERISAVDVLTGTVTIEDAELHDFSRRSSSSRPATSCARPS